MVFLVAVAGLGALCCVPMGIRSRRRRRRLRAFDRAACGGSDDDTPVRSAWIGAWRELQDTAWDCGARWPATATDRDIADVVGAALACEAPERLPVGPPRAYSGTVMFQRRRSRMPPMCAQLWKAAAGSCPCRCSVGGEDV